VADLLECLIQIKGLADTPRRFAQRAADARAGSLSREAAERRVRRLACRLRSAEIQFHECLTSILAEDRPALPALPPAGDQPSPPIDCASEFANRRAETVLLLEACSAVQLNRVGIEPSRGPMTVADIVAVMLAHDTDTLGDLISRG
jgi:hypothetical protein